MSLHHDPRIRQFELKIQGQVEDLAEQVLSGKCESYDDYKKRIGIIKGLKDSVTTMREVLKNFGKDESDFDD